ncbi:LysR family transcriptional regulator [Photobacterium damselae subsp. piscicida]|uniref:LysR family transcriptional regulator n=1 Tax=Photobacterium damselae TaxID=38293 RepID=UPI000303B015|nr:LysR family transcriptional regulator [Photobacterium damselae]TFZ55112.1 LysR family transcriptional regulator [Photobacterium damselae subsp. piscicida]TJZ85023.1 LysR family transcriptional regulator [Photobacterium damselae subsp. piscicida]BBC42440.1 HTH-type transcriptional regulator LeuO [Photobacterium damselae subsp. piscicida]
MTKDLFFTLDLNLLRTFLVLSQELNTRKAAERLFVTQPAISHALQRLRNHFNDELFVKSLNGLQATPFAEELIAQLTPHLDGLSITLNASQEFHPELIERTIKIALAPQVLCAIAGRLFTKVREQAPNIDLQIVNWSMNSIDDIAKGELHFGVNYSFSNVTKEMQSRELRTVHGVIAVRDEHPIKKDTVKPQDLVEYEIASLIIPGWNTHRSHAADVMDSLGFQTKIGFRSEIPSALVDVVLQTDMYFPTSHIFPINRYKGLRTIEVDLPEEQKLQMLYSYYHKKNRNSALTQWLHRIVLELLQELE